jgi:hypothetical protein
MKSCSACSRTYEDVTSFCLDDGTPLTPDGVATEAMTAAPDGTLQEQGTHPQHSVVPGELLAAGTQVGEYVIERKLGEGGMGMIYAASHPIIGKRVAIKELNPAMAANPDVVARFIQEAKSVNQIRHRNIVDIFSFGTLHDGRHYFAMEYLDGESMAGRLARSQMPWHEAIDVLLQVASAVEAAHRNGIAHRDLKPDNIFLSPSPEGVFVKVLDFGIAKLLGDTPMGMSKTSAGMPIGTPTYMSPEQASGTTVDHRTDLYAFGVIVFECVAGRPPFVSPTLVQLLHEHMNVAPPKVADLAQNVDSELVQLIDQLLAKNPSERPPRMNDVRTRLVAMRDRAMVEERPLYGDAMPMKVRAARKGKPVPLAFAGGALVVAIGAGVVAFRSKPPPPVPVVVAPPVDKPLAPAAPRPGKVTVSTNAQAMRVYLDKSATERSTEPAAAGGGNLRVTVPPGVDWVLRVEADGFKPHSMPLRIGDGEDTALPIVLQPEAPPPGPAVAKRPSGPKKPEAPKPQAKKTDDGKFMNPFDGN